MHQHWTRLVRTLASSALVAVAACEDAPARTVAATQADTQAMPSDGGGETETDGVAGAGDARDSEGRSTDAVGTEAGETGVADTAAETVVPGWVSEGPPGSIAFPPWAFGWLKAIAPDGSYGLFRDDDGGGWRVVSTDTGAVLGAGVGRPDEFFRAANKHATMFEVEVGPGHRELWLVQSPSGVVERLSSNPDGFCALTSDGAWALFMERSAADGRQLRARSLASSELTTIGEPAVVDFAPSPDGAWVAIATGAGRARTRVTLWNLRTGDARVLGDDIVVPARFTPDSRHVVYQDGTVFSQSSALDTHARLRVVDLGEDAAPAVTLADESPLGGWEASADGSHVVFWRTNLSFDALFGEAFVVPITGGVPVRLGERVRGHHPYGVGDGIEPAFAMPLIYAADGELREFDAGATEALRVASPAYAVWNAPDGQHFIYQAYHDALYVFDIATQASTKVMDFAYAPVFAADGRSFRFGATVESHTNLYVVSLDAPAAPILLAENAELQAFDLGPDYVIVTLTPESWLRRAVLVRRDGSVVLDLPGLPEWVAWSDAPSRVWFCGFDGLGFRLYVLDLERLTVDYAEFCSSVRTLPDGRCVCSLGAWFKIGSAL